MKVRHKIAALVLPLSMLAMASPANATWWSNWGDKWKPGSSSSSTSGGYSTSSTSGGHTGTSTTSGGYSTSSTSTGGHTGSSSFGGSSSTSGGYSTSSTSTGGHTGSSSSTGGTSVPEPSDLGLFALGLVGLAIGRRSARRRAKKA